jgi:hypothetical protein
MAFSGRLPPSEAVQVITVGIKRVSSTSWEHEASPILDNLLESRAISEARPGAIQSDSDTNVIKSDRDQFGS